MLFFDTTISVATNKAFQLLSMPKHDRCVTVVYTVIRCFAAAHTNYRNLARGIPRRDADKDNSNTYPWLPKALRAHVSIRMSYWRLSKQQWATTINPLEQRENGIVKFGKFMMIISHASQKPIYSNARLWHSRSVYTIHIQHRMNRNLQSDKFL